MRKTAKYEQNNDKRRMYESKCGIYSASGGVGEDSGLTGLSVCGLPCLAVCLGGAAMVPSVSVLGSRHVVESPVIGLWRYVECWQSTARVCRHVTAGCLGDSSIVRFGDLLCG